MEAASKVQIKAADMGTPDFMEDIIYSWVFTDG